MGVPAASVYIAKVRFEGAVKLEFHAGYTVAHLLAVFSPEVETSVPPKSQIRWVLKVGLKPPLPDTYNGYQFFFVVSFFGVTYILM